MLPVSPQRQIVYKDASIDLMDLLFGFLLNHLVDGCWHAGILPPKNVARVRQDHNLILFDLPEAPPYDLLALILSVSSTMRCVGQG